MERRTTKRVVKLTATQKATVKAVVETFDKWTADPKSTNDIQKVIPIDSDPRRDGETYDQRMARLKTEMVPAIPQYRINIPATRSSWRKHENPTDPTLKRLVAIGLLIRHAHRYFAPTPAARAFLAGEKVYETVAVQPKRVEYTVSVEQARADEREKRDAEIARRTATVVEYAEDYVTRMERTLGDIKRAIEKFKTDPGKMLGEGGVWGHTLSSSIIKSIDNTLSNCRPDVLTHAECELFAALAVNRYEDTEPNLDRVKWEYPEEKE